MSEPSIEPPERPTPTEATTEVIPKPEPTPKPRDRATLWSEITVAVVTALAMTICNWGADRYKASTEYRHKLFDERRRCHGEIIRTADALTLALKDCGLEIYNRNFAALETDGDPTPPPPTTNIVNGVTNINTTVYKFIFKGPGPSEEAAKKRIDDSYLKLREALVIARPYFSPNVRRLIIEYLHTYRPPDMTFILSGYSELFKQAGNSNDRRLVDNMTNKIFDDYIAFAQPRFSFILDQELLEEMDKELTED